MKTLLTFASFQIWPQVLSILHAKPSRLALFHTNNAKESFEPAQRLRAFLIKLSLLKDADIDLVPIPHDDFKKIADSIACYSEKNTLDGTNSILNFTGGNKLISLAATEYCRLAGVSCFYLERDLRLFRFRPQGTDLVPEPEFKIDPHLARGVSPLSLLACQISGAEIKKEGQIITLKANKKLNPAEAKQAIKGASNLRAFLDCQGDPGPERVGDPLEYAAAFALLYSGVPLIQRGVCLSSKVIHSSGREEGELDLIFNWAGKLWVVDCKDRLSAENRIDRLRTEILSQSTLSSRLENLLRNLEEELREKDLKVFKEDLLAMSETGGLLGKAICVRSSEPPGQAIEFAKSRGISIVLKDRLITELPAILNPDQPASREALLELAAARTKARN